MTEFRRAGPSDAPAIASLHTRSWRENYRGSFSDAFLDGDLLAERLAVWHARLQNPSEAQLVQLALDGPNLLGFVCVYGAHDPQWGSFVDNLHVAREAKRAGIGAALMRQVGDWLLPLHAERGVYLWVLEPNTTARRFYERLGAANSETTTMETHGGAMVRSCRYTWARAKQLAAA
jgi:ribosomal protein S18 acetylase RimI-like enzyme